MDKLSLNSICLPQIIISPVLVSTNCTLPPILSLQLQCTLRKPPHLPWNVECEALSFAHARVGYLSAQVWWIKLAARKKRAGSLCVACMHKWDGLCEHMSWDCSGRKHNTRLAACTCRSIVLLQLKQGGRKYTTEVLCNWRAGEIARLAFMRGLGLLRASSHALHVNGPQSKQVELHRSA
jgi:hypothetical protein